VNWRAAGCLLVGVAGFVGLGLLAMSMTFNDPGGCPDTLQWDDRTYVASGAPASSPSLSEPGDPSEIGSTFFGLTTRRVFGPPGSSPSERAADRPSEIALDCGNGTFRSYRWEGTLQPTSPGSSP
jgi:hypothetical protein